MASPGHKRGQHLIEGEAYRRIMAGGAPATLDAFARELLDWYRASFPEAAPMTPTAIEREIHATWQRRHELIRGGDP